MFTPQAILLLCLFLQIGLTFWAIMRMGTLRLKSLKTGETRYQDIALASESYPDYVKPHQNNAHNQFETPVLLYVLVILANSSGVANWGVAVGAVIYIVARFLHRAVHVGKNDLKKRIGTFISGLIGLFIGWISLGLGFLGII